MSCECPDGTRAIDLGELLVYRDRGSPLKLIPPQILALGSIVIRPCLAITSTSNARSADIDGPGSWLPSRSLSLDYDRCFCVKSVVSRFKHPNTPPYVLQLAMAREGVYLLSYKD